ncbi:heterocycloanthracin/sonorensin family bacteriocin [Halobacillus trueperi]|uniref:Heterocycloanthracin/sonorensin family bacteriocin n=1 Tax=Halobacillus trueperi TaxID=156205 RepID=A0A3D8VTQ2_9BACI|nr:heterocycloanthracin/sonorensin family bacteriocin [Halobacillus trueperi]
MNEFQNQIQNLDVGEYRAQQLVPSQQQEVYSNDARLCVGLGFGIGGCFGCFSCFGCGGCGGCARCAGCGGCARCAGCGGCARCAGCARCGGRCGGR